MDLFATKPPKRNLLSLPPELREQIFSYAVTSSKPTVTFRLDRYQRESYEQACQPPLTRVNRQVRLETLPLYFGSNDFVFHTEGLKAEDAARWLELNRAHLSKLCRLAVWVRFVAANERAPASGALAVWVRHDVKTGKWVVDEEWKWITVVRKPDRVEWDGRLLVLFLTQLIGGRSRKEMVAGDYVGVLEGLKRLYVKDKMNQVL